MGEFLAQQGYSVLGIRLAGHATQPEDLNRVRWQDWLYSIEDGYHLLKGVSTQIFICGLSLGAALSLYFATRFTVSGIVGMSTPQELPADPRIKFIHIFKWFIPYHKKEITKWQDPETEESHIQYPVHPTFAVAELQSFLRVMRVTLPELTTPTLLIHSRTDDQVHPDNAKLIFQRLGSQDKEIAWIEASDHNVLLDPGHEKVFHLIKNFIWRISENNK